MGMTEKQGGSDVRANVTEARPSSDGTYTLHGHKWFTSAPMNDVFLVLAQAEGGVTCFVVPRVLPDGTRNQLDVVRLKDKLGNRSNASSELELDGTVAIRLGDEGRGVRTIIEMVAATRLDCVLGSAGLMRRAVSEASWHVAHRSAFGSLLADKPLMQNVVADLAVESEAATVLALRLASAVDDLANPHEAALRRIALPLAKFWVCKRTPAMTAEALECLGGNGYVEESLMPLLYREAPLNSVWEGSGNVNALDVLRALAREPEALEAWITEVGLARGADTRLDAAIDATLAMLGELMADPDQPRGRRPPAGRPDGGGAAGLAAGALVAARGGRRLLRLAARVVLRRHLRRARRWRPPRDRGADHPHRWPADPLSRAGQLVEDRAELVVAAGADPVGPLRLETVEQLTEAERGGVALRGAPDDPHSAILGAGGDGEMTRVGELGDELADPLLGHADPLGEVGDRDALRRHMADHAVVGRTESRLTVGQDEGPTLRHQAAQWR